MAFTSIGYDGTVNERQWAELVPSVGSSTYGVKEADDLKVTAVPGQPLVVAVASGTAWGHGVMDTEAANTTITCDPITSGTRWDLIAIRRDWQPLAGGPTSVAKVTGASDRAIPASRQSQPGVIDDQPLALVQWTAGQTQPTQIIDLRCWAGNGGLCAKSDLVRTYMDKIGTEITINGIAWSLQVGDNDMPVWVRGQVAPMFQANTQTVGSGMATDAFVTGGLQPWLQMGTFVGKTSNDGDLTITYPKKFPNGVIGGIGFSGDGMYGVSATPSNVAAPTTSSLFLRFAQGTAPVVNTPVRGTWIAGGW